MNQEIMQPSSQQLPPDMQKQFRTYTLVVYGLYGASILVGLSAIIGVVMAYIKRNEAAGSIYASHLTLLIRTFWWTLLGYLIGGLLLAVGIGAIILLLVTIWFYLRVILGAIKLYNGEAVNPQGWLV